MNIIENFEKQIKELNKKIQNIQDACSHPEEVVTKKHSSSTENYDPSANCYWTDFYCKVCKKQWRLEGSL